MKAIILGAGSGFVSGIPDQGHPAAIHEIPGGRHALDYQIEAFYKLGIDTVVFVAGYHIEQIMEQYPSLHYLYNPVWRTTGSAYSLKEAGAWLEGDILISYSDVLFSEKVVRGLIDTSFDFAVLEDTGWTGRYEGRGVTLQREAEKIISAHGIVSNVGRYIFTEKVATGQFAGLIKVRGEATKRLRSMLLDSSNSSSDRQFHEAESFEKAGITDVLQEMIIRGEKIYSVITSDRWAELDAPQDIAQFVFGTKAETLERLQGALNNSMVLDQIKISLGDWRDQQEESLAHIQTKFPSQKLAIRSSARNEDSWHASNAGRYISFLDINAEDASLVRQRINNVFMSYDDDDSSHQCLVQPFLQNVVLAGVAFTRDPETAAPYYILSYELSGATDGITSGKSNVPTTLIVTRMLNRSTGDARIDRLLASLQEIERTVGYDSLDIEFAMLATGEIYILQVRPLTANRKLQYFSDGDIEQEIAAIKESVATINDQSNLLLGRRSVLGVMPDWNPAEIIGRAPRPLALTLYQYLIVDEVWGIQRAEYGYRNTYPTPLIVGLGGQGYVDVRASFNSFIPFEVPEDLATHLVESYINRLATMPHLHDKVEFEIAFTCLSFDFDSRSKRLSDNGFHSSEIEILKQSLLRLTRNALINSPAFFENQLSAVETLRRRRLQRPALGTLTLTSGFQLVRQMLADCRRFGTLPFAHLARSAFVATELLRSLLRTDVIGQNEYDKLLTSIRTVAGEMAFDLKALKSGVISRQQFLENYGHLRPGTYDILSQRYDENPDGYFSFETNNASQTYTNKRESFSFSPGQQREINRLLLQFDLGLDAEHLIEFIRQSIQGREYSKFEFTRELSDSLKLIEMLGGMLDFTRDDMSFVPIQDFLRIATNPGSGAIKNELTQIIERNRARHQTTKAMRLPHLIIEPGDVECFFLETASPNFITQKRVTAKLFQLGDGYAGEKLDGMIVHIENADPGFDWIFGHQIVGLLTSYGGANSHMAIRTAEFGLPAAIGCGELLAQRWQTDDLIDLNCEAKQIHVIG